MEATTECYFLPGLALDPGLQYHCSRTPFWDPWGFCYSCTLSSSPEQLSDSFFRCAAECARAHSPLIQHQRWSPQHLRTRKRIYKDNISSNQLLPSECAQTGHMSKSKFFILEENRNNKFIWPSNPWMHIASLVINKKKCVKITHVSTLYPPLKIHITV